MVGDFLRRHQFFSDTIHSAGKQAPFDFIFSADKKPRLFGIVRKIIVGDI
jgi:hypothetical protein